MSHNEFLTAQEVAEQLRLSDATIIRWCREGRFPGVKVGKGWRIRQQDLDQWVSQKKEPSS